MGAFAGGYIFTATQTYTLVWTGSVWLAVGAGALALFLKAHPITKAAAS
jgi:hypothetical protein